jgi:hypothetical protein
MYRIAEGVDWQKTHQMFSVQLSVCLSGPHYLSVSPSPLYISDSFTVDGTDEGLSPLPLYM